MAKYPAINKSRAQKAKNLTYKAGRKVEWIVHHYTAGKGTAEENCIYFGREQANASADFFIDLDGTIWQFNADLRNYYSYHCGCNSKYTKWVYNSNSIGIEMVGTGAEFTRAQKDSLRALTLALMEDFGIDADHVVRHYDCNAVHKLCPFAYCGSAKKDEKWRELHAYVTKGEWSDMATKEEIAQAVWGADIKGYPAGHRLYLCNKMDYETSDPTGRGCELNDHDHIKWIAAAISGIQDELREIKAALDIDDKVGGTE